MLFRAFSRFFGPRWWACFCFLLAACVGEQTVAPAHESVSGDNAPEIQGEVAAATLEEPIWLQDLSRGSKPRVFVSERKEGLFAAQPPAGYVGTVHRQGQDQGRRPLIPLGTKLLPKTLVVQTASEVPSVEQRPIVAETSPSQPEAQQQAAQVPEEQQQAAQVQAAQVQATRGTFLQLAALRGEDAALAAGRSLKASFADLLGAYEVILQPVEIDGRGTFQRIRFGPFGSRQEAQATCDALKTRGQDCISIRSNLTATRTDGGQISGASTRQSSPETQNAGEGSNDARQARASGPYLQLISIRDEEKALAAGSSLKAKFSDLLGQYEIDLQSVEIGTRGLFQRVRLGPFASLDSARNTCGALKARGQDCLVVAH